MNAAQGIVCSIRRSTTYVDFAALRRSIMFEKDKTTLVYANERLNILLSELKQTVDEARRKFLARTNLGCKPDVASKTFEKWLLVYLPEYSVAEEGILV